MRAPKSSNQGSIYPLNPVYFRVDSRRNITNFGPLAAINEHRRIISELVLHSAKAEEQIWNRLDNRMESYGIIIEVFGETYNEHGVKLHPYNSKIRTGMFFGGKSIWYGTQDKIDIFKSIKKDFGEPGYKESNNRLVLTSILVKPYVEILRGGSGRSKGRQPVRLANNLWGKDSNLKIGYGDLKAGEDPMNNNNCALRALFEQSKDKKWFKDNFNLRTIRKEFGLPPNCKLSPDDLFRICDDRKLELTITVVRGLDPDTAETSTKKSTGEGHIKFNYQLILQADEEHYYGPASGKYLGNTTISSCDICGEDVHAKDAIRHGFIHKLRHQFKPTADIPKGVISKEDGETDEAFSARYRRYFVNIMMKFYRDPCDEEILGFFGPGGCGKSDVIKTFRESNPDINILCMAKTGVASQNIEGVTIDSFFIKLRSIKELPDLIIIDEISFLSNEELSRLDAALQRHTGKDKPMGGVKTLFMGDFLQLLPFGKNDSCVFNSLFQDNVRAVPMLHGFRYNNDPAFYKLLLQFRSGGVHLSDFLKAGFGMITYNEWIRGFRPDNRPTLLVIRNEDRRIFEAAARNHDMSTNPDLKEYHIDLKINRIEPDPNGRPLTKDEQKLTGSDKGYVHFNVPYPHYKAAFDISLTSKEFGCEINADKHSFYTGERLMTLKNKCDDDGLLMNGTEVFFHSIRYEEDQEYMIVTTAKGEICSIPKVTRGCKFDGNFYLCTGFPVQSAIVSTICKSQGKTYSSIVIDIPRPDKKTSSPHQYYVALSRCTTANKVHFMVRDKSFGSVEEGLKFVHSRLYSKGSKGQQLVVLNPVLVEIMKYTETGGPMYLCPALDLLQDVRNAVSFPGSTNTTYWNPKVPNRTKDAEEHRKFLFKNIIFYDIETGAAVYHENHPKYYKEEEFLGGDNSMRHDQTAWLISFLHIKHEKIVWLREEVERVACDEDKDLLLKLAEFQNDKGIVHIHLDHDDNNYCAKLFMQYLILEARREDERKETNLEFIKKANKKAHLSRYDRLPCTLVGFNSDSFDSKAILHAMDQEDFILPDGYIRNIIRNTGHAITRLSIVNDRWYHIGDLIATHDLFRYMGCQSSLASCHATFMGRPFKGDKEKYMEFCSKYTYDTTLLKNLAEHLVLGKSEFPHLLTQRDGYKPTLSNELKTYDLEDYPDKMQDAVKSVESRTFRMYDKSHEYMDGDIYVLIGAYIGANEANINSGLMVPILSLNTAQQKTTANFLYTGSEIKGLIEHVRYDKWSEKKYFSTRLSLPNVIVQEAIDNATYGGKTLPRVIEWNSEDGSGDYNQLDESGMYADAQEKKNYPYGPHYYTTSSSMCKQVLDSFNSMTHGEQMNDPNGHSLKFPFMYIAEVTIQIPSLCIDPYIPFHNQLNQLDWGICNTDSTDGTRRQWLTSITIGLLKNMGGKLLQVHGVVLWEKYGPIYRKYLEKLNEKKYTTKDPVEKLDAKLDANANYGASLKRDKDTVTMTVYNGADWQACDDKIDFSQPWSQYDLPNGTSVVQGHLKADLKEYSSRPTYLGAFVLGHSQFKLGIMAMVGAGETYIPRTLTDAREGLINQPLYGDTDSLFIHETYIKRLLQHADNGGVRYLYDTTLIKDRDNVTTKEKLDKLGKYCDEVANDYGCGDMVDYRKNIYTRVILFAANAPKSYGALLKTPDGQVIPKNRIKGIKEGAYTLYASSDGSTKRTVDGECVVFNKKSEAITRMIYRAVTESGIFLSTIAPRTFKSFGFIPQKYEKSVNNMGETRPRDPWTITISTVDRDVVKTILTRRRLLTGAEVSKLQLNEYDARRILVPNGWNWDGALFNLN